MLLSVTRAQVQKAAVEPDSCRMRVSEVTIRLGIAMLYSTARSLFNTNMVALKGLIIFTVLKKKRVFLKHVLTYCACYIRSRIQLYITNSCI